MTISKNRVVSIDYTLTDDKNNLIDSTSGEDPLEYLHGFENIIPGLEKLLEGKGPGDHFSVAIPAEEAYGDRDENLIAQIPRENFEDIDEVIPGMQFHAQDEDGEMRVITVTKVESDMVTIDGNHPLAGLNLNFDVTVVSVREAREEELAHGHAHGSHSHGHCQGCDDSECGDQECCGHGGCGGCQGH